MKKRKPNIQSGINKNKYYKALDMRHPAGATQVDLL